MGAGDATTEDSCSRMNISSREAAAGTPLKFSGSFSAV